MLTVLLVLGGLFLTTPSPAAEAQDTQGCVVNTLGVKVCGTLLGQPLPEVATITVQGPTVTVPPVTVTDVVTVRPDPIRLTETIRPDPVRTTETVTLPPAPQATVTVTENADGTPIATSTPQPTVTETVRPNGEPVPTVTQTVTEEPEQVTRQDPDESGSIEPEQDDEPFFSPDVDFDFTDPTITEAGIGLLSALLLIGLIMGSMLYGFHRGRKSEQSGEADFLRTLLDRSKTS